MVEILGEQLFVREVSLTVMMPNNIGGVNIGLSAKQDSHR